MEATQNGQQLTVQQALELATKHHQAGNFADAETLYRRILQAQPRNPDALHLLGVLAYQLGRIDLAVDYTQQALRIHPQFPAAHNNLGIFLKDQGKLDEAIANYRQALRLKPDFAEAYYNLANAVRDQGKDEEAITNFQHALRLKPNYCEAHNNLGNALKNHGRVEEAIASYQQALRCNPNYCESYNNLGNALKTLGKVEEAIANYRQALRLKPDFAEAYNNLGNALKDQGKVEEAITSYQYALRLKPNYADARNNLGNALKDQGKLAEAIASYQQALSLNPSYFEAYNNLGIALLDQGKAEEAVASYRQSLRIKPDYAEAHNNMGIALRAQLKDEEAICSYREALRLKPNYADAQNNLGVAFTELGRIDEAIASFQDAIHSNPKHADALFHLASLLRGKLPDADRAILEQRVAESDLTDPDRAKVLFGLAEMCDARGEYARAVALLREANALSLSVRRHKGQGYDPEEHARFVENLINAFPPAFFERMRGFGLETERPVFIVGLPRSGTTLTEQILATHSQVYGAGELALARKDFLDLGTQPTDESVFKSFPAVRGDAFRRQAQWHLDQLGILNRTARRVVDKMPDNYFHLGLLAALFPRAKFIHCRRDLRDVAVSCWITNFREYAWANDAEHIAARFQEYQRLMEHWRKVLPVAILEVQYEETVADLPRVARSLVEWCGLDWEPACLAFHESKNPVRTASVAQVRQPIYTNSVARWRNYERDLSSLFTTLAPLQ